MFQALCQTCYKHVSFQHHNHTGKQVLLKFPSWEKEKEAEGEVSNSSKSHTAEQDSLEAKTPVLKPFIVFPSPPFNDPIFPERCLHRKEPQAPFLQLQWFVEEKGCLSH